jgi:hypothetical protein
MVGNCRRVGTTSPTSGAPAASIAAPSPVAMGDQDVGASTPLCPLDGGGQPPGPGAPSRTLGCSATPRRGSNALSNQPRMGLAWCRVCGLCHQWPMFLRIVAIPLGGTSRSMGSVRSACCASPFTAFPGGRPACAAVPAAIGDLLGSAHPRSSPACPWVHPRSASGVRATGGARKRHAERSLERSVPHGLTPLCEVRRGTTSRRGRRPGRRGRGASGPESPCRQEHRPAECSGWRDRVQSTRQWTWFPFLVLPPQGGSLCVIQHKSKSRARMRRHLIRE